MRTLYAPGPWQAGDEPALPDEEARHGRTVLRLATGNRIRLIDGAGRVGEAVVVQVDRQALRCRLEQVAEPPRSVAAQLQVAVCPPKGPRFTDLVRQLAELGVGRLLPLVSQRAERRPQLQRARRVAIEAAKQSGQAHLLEVTEVVDFATFAPGVDGHILLDPDGEPALRLAASAPPTPTTLIVGPEGGFTQAERRQLLDAGARPGRLAASILRIETAAVAAAAVWIAAWEQHVVHR